MRNRSIVARFQPERLYRFAMSWDSSLTQLVDLLAGIYRNPSDAELVARRAGLPLENLDLSGRPKTMWMRIVEEARLQNCLDALVAAVHEQYPNIDFPTLKRQSDHRGSVGSTIDERDWKGSDLSGNHLEKVTGAQPTFLPISFLETGIACQSGLPGDHSHRARDRVSHGQQPADHESPCHFGPRGRAEVTGALQFPADPVGL